MAKRWYVCPVVLINGIRKPKVAEYRYQIGTDPDDGSPLFKPFYDYRAVISGGVEGQRNDIAICLAWVRPDAPQGTDFSMLDNDSQIIDIAAEIRQKLGRDWEEGDRTAWYNMTPGQIGLSRGELNQVLKKMTDVGADTTGLGLDTTLGVYFSRLADLIDFNLDVRQVW